MEEVLNELKATRFPKCYYRTNVSGKPIYAFTMGKVFSRRYGKITSKNNTKFRKLYRMIRALIKKTDPDFKYTTIQLNKNVKCAPHVDISNKGPSYLISLGDYSGGEVCVRGECFDTHNNWLHFDGTDAHWTTAFKGERYSLIFFTPTFKPPHPSKVNLKVTKHTVTDKKGNVVDRF